MLLLKEGNRKAFECIYQRHWLRLYDVAYGRLKSKEAAEEVVQDLFTYIWIKRETISLNYTFATYIQVALRYKVFNYIRKEVSRKKNIQIAQQLQPIHHNGVSEGIDYNELSELIEKEVSKLPEKCRQVFKLSRND